MWPQNTRVRLPQFELRSQALHKRTPSRQKKERGNDRSAFRELSQKLINVKSIKGGSRYLEITLSHSDDIMDF